MQKGLGTSPQRGSEKLATCHMGDHLSQRLPRVNYCQLEFILEGPLLSTESKVPFSTTTANQRPP
jgi:hypothetical protein